MAKTIIPFVPSQVQAPQFVTTFDANQYSISVLWLLFSQRYYIQVLSLSQELVLFTSMVGSPVGLNIQAATWSKGLVLITTVAPHGLTVGQSLDVTITGMTPDAYNGFFEALVTSPTQFTYGLASDPGAQTVLGSVEQNVDLLQGLFDTKLIFRSPLSWFEVVTP